MPSLTPEHIVKFAKFLNISEKLKCELRNSWLSSERQESVAEHSWRMSLMVILFAPYLSQPVDVEKCIKMAIIHDLAEAEVGDIPAFEVQTPEAKRRKHDLESKAMLNICASLHGKLGEELISLWQEYEEKQSFEAKFINALDKIEVHLQQIEAPLSTWNALKREMFFQDKWLKTHCNFEPSLLAFADEVLKQGIKKLQDAGEDVSLIAHHSSL